ncbi:hypothetical protein [Streptomyces pharetrae]|uniref:hypothetical protein n=1 Tax=Streptomyces pharetrae TaxID=291370 RepID=UPI0013027ACC
MFSIRIVKAAAVAVFSAPILLGTALTATAAPQTASVQLANDAGTAAQPVDSADSMGWS